METVGPPPAGTSLRPAEGAPNAAVLAAFSATVFLFGVNFVAIRVVVEELDPTWSALIRFAPGAALLVALALATRAPWPRGRGLAAAALFGVFAFGLASLLLYWALLTISAGLGSLIFATVPLSTFLIAVAVRQERYRWQGLVGALMAIVGIAWISNGDLADGVTFLPTVAAFGAAICVGASAIVLKAVPPMHPVSVNAVGMATGAAVLLVGVFLLGDHVAAPNASGTVAALVWLVLSASAATVLIVYVLNRWTASATAYQTVLSPPVTVIAAAAILAEPITYTLVLGGALVLAGTWVGAIWTGRVGREKWAVRLLTNESIRPTVEPQLALPLYRVDAFVGKGLKGNPAGVCLTAEEITDEQMVAIAAEVGASETAFVRPQGGADFAKARSFELRWFTPTVEVPLCGHATLATAAVLFGQEKVPSSELMFDTKSGTLEASKEGDAVALDFPSDPPEERGAPKEVLEAMGLAGVEACAYGKLNRKLLLLLADEQAVRAVKPAFGRLKSAAPDGDIQGVIVTAPGTGGVDFVSRYFGPWVGIDEDPVTGSAHTVLGPFWAERLGKKEFNAVQLSERGGAITVRVRAGRVDLVGAAKVGAREEIDA